MKKRRLIGREFRNSWTKRITRKWARDFDDKKAFKKSIYGKNS